MGAQPNLTGRGSFHQLVKWLLGVVVLSGLCALALDGFGLNLFGFGSMDVARNGLAFSMVGLLVSLFLPQADGFRVGLIVLIPLLTQFYQLSLGWDHPLGPSSLIRVLPYVAIWMAAGASLVRHRPTLSGSERWAWGASAAVGALGAIGSVGEPDVAVAGLLLFALILPTIALYLRVELERTPEAANQMVGACLVGFLAFGIGTFVVIRLGSGLELGGVSGLLGTRNVSDYNLIFAYMVLLWPMAVLGASWGGPLAVGALGLVFLGSSVVGLSRTGMLLIPVLVIVALVLLYGKQPARLAQALIAMIVAAGIGWTFVPQRETLGLIWAQRFNVTNIAEASSVFARIRPGGEDSEARDQLRAEAMRLFWQEPLAGQGLGGFASQSVRGYNDAHSLSITVLAELGLFGGIALAVFLGFLLLRLLKLATTSGGWVNSLFLLSFVVWLFAVHTVGGNLAVLATRGFNVNAINALLLIVYLLAHHLVKSGIPKPKRPVLEAA